MPVPAMPSAATAASAFTDGMVVGGPQISATGTGMMNATASEVSGPTNVPAPAKRRLSNPPTLYDAEATTTASSPSTMGRDWSPSTRGSSPNTTHTPTKPMTIPTI